ncbi:MAG: type II secretion system F family protein [Bradyrhizobiaceae bacterium]|nr:type II secretion system F family protein [Bradyrhizobiaceae bacterium]
MLQALIIPALATLAVGGVAYVFLYPLLSGERRAEQRTREIALADMETRRARKGADAATSRRQQIEETLKQVEARQRSRKNPPLAARLQQAGVRWSKRQYWFGSAVLGLVAFAIPLVFGQAWYIALGLGLAAGLGLPRWTLAFMKKRREDRFVEELPNAIDVIVRGVKSGLPLGDCIRIIASESRDPLKSEFRTIAESTAIGMPLGEACAKLYDRVPLPEANFFAIVIAIQQRSGGNLAEALSNLSRVLRDRKKMKAKIKAVSTEAKASAAIIGSLPVAVMILVYLTSPTYIELLWTHPTGRIMLAASAGWMLVGSLVMRRMINFEI